MTDTLKLQPLGIGSLPHKNPDDAMRVVEQNFSQIPFFPQLANISRNEDMMLQFLEGLPSFSPDSAEKFTLNSESDEFLMGLEEFFSDYEEIISVKPGLTGLWQVSGRNELSYDERIRINLYYIRNWSIWLDYYILLKTPHEIFSAHGQ